MALDVDGYAVLAAIAAHRDAFPAIRGEVGKTARAFVGKQLKDKDMGLPGLHAVAKALGPESFDLVVDGLTDAEVKALLAKADKLNAVVKAAPPAEQRRHLSGLARGTLQPAEKAAPAAKAPKAPKPAKEPKPAVERSGNSKAMRAKKKV